MLDSFYWGQPEELLSFGSFFLSRCVPPILQFVKICLHIICSLVMKPFSRFSKIKVIITSISLFFSAFLVYYNDTFIWKAFNLYIFPNHISFWLLFLWNPFHISYYTPSTLICQLVFCIICFLFFKAIWISWQFDKLPLYYSMYIHFFSFWKLAIYRHFDLLVSLLQKPKSVPGSISPCL